MAESGVLTVQQIKLVTRLAQGGTVADACKDSHIAGRTATRWLALPHVKAALEEARQASFVESLHVLRQGVRKAMGVLVVHMSATVEPTAATQLAAAKYWIEQSVLIYQNAEHEKRLAALEERAGLS